jgi:hypothetical protein
MHGSPALKELVAYITGLQTANPGKKIVLVAYRNRLTTTVDHDGNKMNLVG